MRKASQGHRLGLSIHKSSLGDDDGTHENSTVIGIVLFSGEIASDDVDAMTRSI